MVSEPTVTVAGCLDRTPNSESEVCPEREAYALSAGFALGMVTLGKGDAMPELSDLNMSDKLYHFMTGKHRRSHTSSMQWYTFDSAVNCV